MNNYKLHVGDELTIWFEQGDNPRCYADCTYKGKRNGKWVFRSNTYGWRYFIDIETGEVTNDNMPGKIMKVNNESGWMKILP